MMDDLFGRSRVLALTAHEQGAEMKSQYLVGTDLTWNTCKHSTNKSFSLSVH